MKKTILYIWLFTLICVLVQPTLVYNELPDQLATSFDLQNNPNGYGSKDQFLILWIALIVFINGVMLFITSFVWRVAPTKFNVPNRMYWLSTEANRSIVQEKVSTGMKMIATACNLLLMSVFYLIYIFNTQGRSPFDAMLVMAGFVVLMLAIVVYFLSSFRMPPTNSNPYVG
jgi:uncharacterized membrane protein